MKKTLLFLGVGILIGGLIVLLVNYLSSASQVKPVEKSSFEAVTSKLDPGGNLYFYVSTEKVIQSIDEFAGQLRKMMEKEMAKSGSKDPEPFKIFDFIYGLIKKSGLMEISGVGFSSVPIDSKDSIFHCKFVVHHFKENGKGLIWQLHDTPPHNLDMLEMLPANTVYANIGDAKIKFLWDWIKKEFNASDFPKLKEGIASVEPGLKTLGIDLDQLLSSLNPGMGVIFTLDKSAMRTIPIGDTGMKIPDPSLALVFSVKNDYIFKLLQSKLPMAKKTEEKNMKKLQFPLPPMPITVEPVFVQKDNLFIVASNNKIVNAMFEGKEKGNGLISTDEFKKMSEDVPNRGNEFLFLGSDLLSTIMDVIKTGMKSSGDTDPDEEEAFNMVMNILPKKLAIYGVRQNSDEGQVVTFNHTLKLENIALLPATALAGIVSAIAIPNMLTAVEKGKQKETMGDMRSISIALESYITDNNKLPPGKTLMEIQTALVPFHIKTLPLKDAWGNDFYYLPGRGTDYFIGSAGKDGVFNGWDQTGTYYTSTVSDYGNDIIFSNGTFTYSPEIH